MGAILPQIQINNPAGSDGDTRKNWDFIGQIGYNVQDKPIKEWNE